MTTKLSTPPLKFSNTKETYYFTYLFTALSSSACTNLPITLREELLDIILARPSTECSW